MAFNTKKFGVLHGNAGGTLRIYAYDNADNDTLTTAGFFPASLGLQTGDKILVFGATGAPSWMNITVSATTGVATAAKLA